MSFTDHPDQFRPLTEVLPHRPPLLLLDAYLIEEQNFSAQVLIKKESLLFKDPFGVPSWAGIEYMAQAAGVLAATLLDEGSPKKPSVGFLVKIKGFKTTVDYFHLNQKLNLRVEPLHRGLRESLFKASIQIDGTVVCKSQFMTFLKSGQV